MRASRRRDSPRARLAEYEAWRSAASRAISRASSARCSRRWALRPLRGASAAPIRAEAGRGPAEVGNVSPFKRRTSRYVAVESWSALASDIRIANLPPACLAIRSPARRDAVSRRPTASINSSAASYPFRRFIPGRSSKPTIRTAKGGTFAAACPQRWSTILLKARREQNVPSTNETDGQSASGCALGARDSTRNTPWTRHGRPAPSANQRPKSSTS